MARSNAPIVGGHIDSGLINETHNQIKKIVEEYKEVNLRVKEVTNIVKDNWVGEGRDEFESQYELLISKIDDFGDTLQEIYEALVDAEKAYTDADDQLRQNFVMSQES